MFESLKDYVNEQQLLDLALTVLCVSTDEVLTDTALNVVICYVMSSDKSLSDLEDSELVGVVEEKVHKMLTDKSLELLLKDDMVECSFGENGVEFKLTEKGIKEADRLIDNGLQA